MEDNNDNEILKRKKIRRLLLLKTDEELKKISKKNSSILINSKTIQEMNKSYNIYDILLSEESKIYSNYIKTEEKIVKNKIFEGYVTGKSIRDATRDKILEKPIKLINSTFEQDSISPILSFLPKKIDLGKRKFSSFKKDVDQISIEITDKNKIEKETTNEDKINYSTRGVKRSLYRLIDKILIIKMNEDEDAENIIKKNIIKLKKYCNKFIIKRKRIKKVKIKKENSSKNLKEKNYKKKCITKTMTINGNNSFLRKSLFENRDKKIDYQRTERRVSTVKYPNIKIIEIDEISNKKKNKAKKEKKFSSSKIIKTKNYIKNTEIDKKYESSSSIKKILKENLMSSKFQKPSKFFINNFNKITKISINNNSNNIKKDTSKTKINSLFINSKISNNKEKKGNIISFFNSKEKNKGKNNEKSHIKKNNKNKIKIYENFFLNNDKSELNKLKEKYDINKEEIKKPVFIISSLFISYFSFIFS